MQERLNRDLIDGRRLPDDHGPNLLEEVEDLWTFSARIILLGFLAGGAIGLPVAIIAASVW
jgi:hypothetical protein